MNPTDIEELKQSLKSKFQDNKEIQAQIDSLTEKDLQALQNKSPEDVLTFLGSQKTNDDEITVNENYQNDTNQNTSLNVDELLPETNQNEDWKDRIRAKEKEANQELGTDFQEVKTDDKSAPLTFRDDKGNTHEFSDENHCRVAGDQVAFDQLARTAKKLGKEAINFGEFKEHPEYRTRLYLACLKEGIQPIGNIPTAKEIENSPEYKEIHKELIKKNRKEVFLETAQSRKKLEEAQTTWEKDPEYKTLTTAYNTARKNQKLSPSDANKEALEKAEAAINKNPAYSNLNTAKKQYHEAVTKAKEFYLEYGSEKDAETTTRKQREERLDKHLEKYNPKEFFKDNDGNPLANHKKQIRKYQATYNALKGNSR